MKTLLILSVLGTFVAIIVILFKKEPEKITLAPMGEQPQKPVYKPVEVGDIQYAKDSEEWIVTWVTKNGQGGIVKRGDDTVGSFGSGAAISAEEYNQREQMTERQIEIVDSLKVEGIFPYQDLALTYEPMYMKAGTKKKYTAWQFYKPNLTLLEYEFHHDINGGHGTHLIRETEL